MMAVVRQIYYYISAIVCYIEIVCLEIQIKLCSSLILACWSLAITMAECRCITSIASVNVFSLFKLCTGKEQLFMIVTRQQSRYAINLRSICEK